MRTCKDKRGIFATMFCVFGEPCGLYDEPEHCIKYREYRENERNLKVASDSKQTKF